MFTFVVAPGLVAAVVPGAYSAASVAAEGFCPGTPPTVGPAEFVALKTPPVVGAPLNGGPPAIARIGWFRILKNSARNSRAPPSPRNPNLVSLAIEKSHVSLFAC